MSIPTKISEENRKTIAEGLCHLLADSYLLYVKTQNYHWNVTGPMFPQLHTLFEQQYTDLAAAIDQIAERIRALGQFAPGSFTAFQQLAKVKEETGHPKADGMIKQLIQDQETVVAGLHTIFPKVSEAGDEATADLLTDRISIHEKNIWMLKALLE